MKIIKNKNHLLGVFGDSFASKEVSPHKISGEPWVLTLSRLLDIESVVISQSGTSIWWSFKNFLDHYKSFSHIVFVYSQHNRWHCLSKEHETMHHITTNKKFISNLSNEKEKVSKILLDAYPIVNSEQFDIYVYQKIFNDVNQICKDNNIKLINFMPFDNGTLINYSNSSGFCIYNAISLIDFEQKHLTNDEKEKFMKMLYAGDLRYCHMNWKNNKIVATRMFENLHNTNAMLNIIKDNDISSDPQCIKELFDYCIF